MRPFIERADSGTLGIVPDPGPETRVRSFIDGINAENESGAIPAADFLPADDPIGFLINRVDAVVIESAQLGTEPLTTKAAVLAALFQARALEEIADEMESIANQTASISVVLSEMLEHFKYRFPPPIYRDEPRQK